MFLPSVTPSTGHPVVKTRFRYANIPTEQMYLILKIGGQDARQGT
nr:MAG TPA: hypothetical protein [Caudoviricetes sp.]